MFRVHDVGCRVFEVKNGVLRVERRTPFTDSANLILKLVQWNYVFSSWGWSVCFDNSTSKLEIRLQATWQGMGVRVRKIGRGDRVPEEEEEEEQGCVLPRTLKPLSTQPSQKQDGNSRRMRRNGVSV